jgi:hypothetical protein
MRGFRTRRGGPSVPFTDAPPGFLPRAKPRGRPSVRPRSLPPLPACRPTLKNSNRESLRLEIHLTQTKQTIANHSNREEEACFFGPSRGGCFRPPAVRPSSCRRARPAEVRIHPGTRNQNSNREKEPCFSNHDQPTRGPRKSRGVGSPRPRVGFGCWSGLDWVALGIGNTRGHNGRVVNPFPYAEKRTPIARNNTNRRLPNLFRLETTPFLCFVNFTRSLN